MSDYEDAPLDALERSWAIIDQYAEVCERAKIMARVHELNEESVRGLVELYMRMVRGQFGSGDKDLQRFVRDATEKGVRAALKDGVTSGDVMTTYVIRTTKKEALRQGYTSR